MSAVVRKGWCPGALRPMETGDGYLVRLRVANGILAIDRAIAIAALSREFGNGQIDLSARANLQLRGIRQNQLGPLRTCLADLELLDENVASEAVRNVAPSPLAGIDVTAVLDARPIVVAIEARLTGEPALHGLPAKFGFLVDGGGHLRLGGLASDVRFEACAGPAGPRLAVRLGDAAAGWIAPAQAADAASAIARAFLTLRRDETRMAPLVGRTGAAAIARLAGIVFDPDIPAAAERVELADVLGVHSLGASCFLGAAVAFGALRADDLSVLAMRAQDNGARELRLTAWRALLIPGLELDTATALAAQVASVGFILDPCDRRLSLAACAGKPACASAHADVRSIALLLASRLKDFAGTLHVSGCPKGCAHHARAPITLVATPDGFDLVRDGWARDTPIRRGITSDALAAYVSRELKGAPA